MQRDNRGASGADGPSPPYVTIVAPTKNEARNIEEFVKRVSSCLDPLAVHWDIVFADDSDDETISVIDSLVAEGAPLRYVHRRAHERRDSISGAINAALAVVSAEIVVVIDADLQHPPEVLPFMIGPIATGHADFSVGTRYRDIGSAEGLGSTWRRVASRSTGAFIKVLFPQYWPCTDMASGLFAFRRADLGPGRQRSTGFKFLPEALVRCDPQRVADVPYRFEQRFDGLSKARIRDGITLARWLLALRLTTGRLRPVSRVEDLMGLDDAGPPGTPRPAG